MHRQCQASLGLMLLCFVACGANDDSDNTDSKVFVIELLQEGGDYTISGTVSLSENTSSGHAIQFLVRRVDAPQYIVIEPLGSTNDAGTFNFRIVNASDGGYKIAARVDANDSGVLDTGDLDGYYDGTVSSPTQDDDAARTITIAGASVQDINFGLGERP